MKTEHLKTNKLLNTLSQGEFMFSHSHTHMQNHSHSPRLVFQRTLKWLGLGLVLGTMIVFGSLSAHAVVKCKTHFGEKSFIIREDLVVFQKEDEHTGRAISSVDQVRTEKKHQGYDKVLFLDGLKHRIHIEKASEFSDVEDYMVVTSPKGHEMTYPLNCEKI
jgi:hypothetical protein